jgi:serine/threonine protein kinase
VYKNRIFSCLVISSAGRTIKEFRSIKELLTALRDAVKAHRSLFEKAQILHRDISENNIIITDPQTADGFTGMLIDLDLAIVDGERTGGRHMTGTMEFMAIDVLRGVEHTYRHDLESFFYVLLWMCARRAWEREFHCKRKDRSADSLLRDWYGDTTKKVAGTKQGSMHTDGFDDVLMEFAPTLDCIKALCRELRNILFPLTKAGKLDLTIKPDPRKLYDPFIKAFGDAIAGLETDA